VPDSRSHAPADSGDWNCAICGESSPASFDACWNCGATGDGRPNPDFRPERELWPPEPSSGGEKQPAARRLAVATGIVAVALVLLRVAGPVAVVLTPLAYLYFVFFSPRDRPVGHVVVKVMMLLAVGSFCAQRFLLVLFRSS
jgi:hypothetical protein